MHGVVSLAVRVASSDVPVLLTGPSGTGKEHLSEVIHANSRRRSRPFVRVNAGGLPDALLEAELFGAEPGAYTGADSRRIGRFEAADGGTLLLDEIGNLSPSGQARLLRVLQSGEYQRLGSSQTRRADVRILAATNADLASAIAAGTFREDLLFRLNVVEIEVPPLAGRDDDIRALAAHFLERLRAEGRAPLSFSEAAERALLEHRWPGNVRELKNRVQRAIVVVDGEEITPADLDLPVGGGVPASGPGPVALADEDEKRRIEAALLDCGGVIARAADVLGVSRQALYRRMERLGITVERRLRS